MARKNVAASREDIAEEIALLRQRCNSLALRGHYTECAKLIEDNLKLLYINEYWPENFFSTLRTYQRCYPALGRSETLEERLSELLKKNDIPFVFALFLKPGEAPPNWRAEHFKDCALKARSEEKDSASALAYCELALKIDPASTNLNLLCGWILEDMGRDAEAISKYERALELNASNIMASRGVTRLLTKTNLAKALAYVDKAIEDAPREAGLHAEKAGILLKQGKKQEAMVSLEKASDLDPYNPEYPYQKAEMLLSWQDEAAAVIQYKRAAALNNKHAPSLFRLAFLHEKKQPAAALEYITAYTAAEPGNAEALLLKASLMLKLGDPQGAAKQYRALLEIDDKNTAALAGIGGCCLPDNPTVAVDYYSRAAAIEPDNEDFRLGKAKAHMLLNQYAAAAAEYKAVTGLNRKNDHAYGRLARIYAESEPASALEYINKAIALAPENPSYHAEKAWLLLNAGKRSEAIASFDMAVKHEPGNASLHFQLGVLLKEAGNRASAVKNLEEAINIDTRLPQAYRSLAELYMYSEPDKAFLHINSAMGLDIANDSLYCLKSRIIVRLGEDRHALDTLFAPGNKKPGRDGGDPDEMEAIRRGEYLKVALLYINRAIELSPGNITYMCDRADIFYRMKQISKAMEQYLSLLKEDGNNHEALYGAGLILLSKKDKKALEYFDKAIAASPATARYHTGKGDFLSLDGARRAEAIECYNQALLLDTYDYEPSLKKSRLLLVGGDVFTAMDSFRRTLLINPNCLEAAAKMGELLADIQPDNALNYIEHAIFLDPESKKARMWRARILYAQNNREAAAEQCREILEMFGHSAEGAYALARILDGAACREALEYAIMAAEKDSAKAEHHSLCGKIYLELGDDDKAGPCFQKAMALDPKDSEARELAVEYMYRKGMPEAVEAAGALAATQRAMLLKAKVFTDLADPPRTGEAIEILAEAVKRYPDDMPLREELVALLQKKKAFLRLTLEKSKLARLRKKLEKALAEAAAKNEIVFSAPGEGKDEKETKEAKEIEEAEKAKETDDNAPKPAEDMPAHAPGDTDAPETVAGAGLE